MYEINPNERCIKWPINNDKVGGALSNYAGYIDLSLATALFWANVKNGGGDIRIVDKNGNELAREIVSCDTEEQTGEVHYLLPSLSADAGEYVLMYYGNPEAEDYAPTDTYGRNAVWSAYGFISHLQNNANDATVNNRNGVLLGSVTGADSKILRGLSFSDSTNDQVLVINSAPGLGFSGDFSYEAFVYPTSVASRNTVMEDIFSSSDRHVIQIDSNGRIAAAVYNGSSYSGKSGSIAINNWYHLVFTRQSGVYKLYINAIPQSGTSVNPQSDSGGFFIGSRPTIPNRQPWSGIMDEVRAINIALSQAQITTEYNNQNSPATFYGTPIDFVVKYEKESPLAYFIKKVKEITKDLSYKIFNRFEKTKDITYAVVAPNEIVKAVGYAIKKDISLTPDLSYFIKTTKELQTEINYEIITPGDLVIPARYSILTSPEKTKALAYFIKNTGEITKSLHYEIATLPDLTKSLQYTILTSGELVKSMRYELKFYPFTRKASPFTRKASPYTRYPIK